MDKLKEQITAILTDYKTKAYGFPYTIERIMMAIEEYEKKVLREVQDNLYD